MTETPVKKKKNATNITAPPNAEKAGSVAVDETLSATSDFEPVAGPDIEDEVEELPTAEAKLTPKQKIFATRKLIHDEIVHYESNTVDTSEHIEELKLKRRELDTEIAKF